MAKKKEKAEVKKETKTGAKEEHTEKLPDAIEEGKQATDYSKQTKVLALVMAVLIISTVGAYWLVKKDETVEFQGIEFSKSQEGNILYYKSLLGYATASGEEIPFILKLRTSPEELAEIPVTGKVELLRNAVITLSPQIANCSNTPVTMLNMGMILKAFGIIAIAATTNRNYSIQNNATLADCRSSLNKTVIVFQEGNETRIDQETFVFKNCYVVSLKNCEVREGYERFILQYVIDGIVKR